MGTQSSKSSKVVLMQDDISTVWMAMEDNIQPNQQQKALPPKSVPEREMKMLHGWQIFDKTQGISDFDLSNYLFIIFKCCIWHSFVASSLFYNLSMQTTMELLGQIKQLVFSFHYCPCFCLFSANLNIFTPIIIVLVCLDWFCWFEFKINFCFGYLSDTLQCNYTVITI